MRQLFALLLVALGLAACGSDEPTVVTAPPGSAVVVPQNGDAPRVVTPTR
jgi:hypothetical protein